MRASGKNHLAHRLSFDVFVGAIPKGAFVCHTCDVKRCINPEHLYLGDAKTNKRDELLRSPGTYGGRKLTVERAREVFLDPRDAARVASEQKIHRDSVYNIRARRTWATATADLIAPARQVGGIR